MLQVVYRPVCAAEVHPARGRRALARDSPPGASPSFPRRPLHRPTSLFIHSPLRPRPHPPVPKPTPCTQPHLHRPGHLANSRRKPTMTVLLRTGDRRMGVPASPRDSRSATSSSPWARRFPNRSCPIPCFHSKSGTFNSYCKFMVKHALTIASVTSSCNMSNLWTMCWW